jgi:Flp pilus assembly protein TadG
MRKDERGQSMVEMALILPILLLLVVGITDVGRVVYSYAHLQMAAQESVRLGGLDKNDQDITNFADQYVKLGDPSKLIVTITPKDTDRHSGDYVTVQLSYPFTFDTPFISLLFPSPFYIETQSTIRVE